MEVRTKHYQSNTRAIPEQYQNNSRDWLSVICCAALRPVNEAMYPSSFQTRTNFTRRIAKLQQMLNCRLHAPF
jgi:hypothetical protein